MSVRTELLKRLETEIEAVRSEAAARERLLRETMTSEADGGRQDEEWQALCQRLETYRLTLEARITESSDQVEQAGGNQDEIETALRTWLADAQKLAGDFQLQV